MLFYKLIWDEARTQQDIHIRARIKILSAHHLYNERVPE